MTYICDPRRKGGSRGIRVRATSVSYIDAEGQLVKRVGSSTADRMIAQLMKADASPCEELSVGDFYCFAVVAQAAQSVANGACETFSRICHCSVHGELVPCLIQVEPYFTEQTLAGAKVTCLNVVTT
jgi:hypothetical protein